MKKSIQNLISKLSKTALNKAGFTMIELLVVISVIGVLAVAVLSSINPIEQINKGRDTSTRSDAAQLINAVDRYFAIQEYYPWNVDNTGTGTPGDGFTATVGQTFDDEITFIGAGYLNTPVGITASYTDWDWVDDLLTTSEVKEGFVVRLKSNNDVILFKGQGTNETMYACFLPSSQAFKRQAYDNCVNGTVGDTVQAGLNVCPSGLGAAASQDDDNLICLP